MNVQERPQAEHYQTRAALVAEESLSQGDGRGAKGGDRSIYQYTGSVRQADYKIRDSSRGSPKNLLHASEYDV